MENTLCTKSVNIFYMSADTELAKLIDDEMKKRNLGLRQAAVVIGTSHPTLSRALAGEPITFEFGVQLARFLHMPPEQVFRITGLLPQIPADTEQRQQLMYKFDQLDDRDRKTILDMMNFLLSK